MGDLVSIADSRRRKWRREGRFNTEAGRFASRGWVQFKITQHRIRQAEERGENLQWSDVWPYGRPETRSEGPPRLVWPEPTTTD
jgi:hypothetical protein